MHEDKINIRIRRLVDDSEAIGFIIDKRYLARGTTLQAYTREARVRNRSLM